MYSSSKHLKGCSREHICKGEVQKLRKVKSLSRNLTTFFVLENASLMAIGSISKQINVLYNSGLLFPRIRDPRATFKAVLMAVDMTWALQTKCKTCLGGPRMILHAH